MKYYLFFLENNFLSRYDFLQSRGPSMHLLRLLLTILFLTPLSAEYYSQYGQDQFVHEKFFKDKKDGVFIEIGAYDGKNLSNTFFFEKELGWEGICIEPLPHVYQILKQNRSCTCIQGCIAEKNGSVSFMQVSGVEMLTSIITLNFFTLN